MSFVFGVRKLEKLYRSLGGQSPTATYDALRKQIEELKREAWARGFLEACMVFKRRRLSSLIEEELGPAGDELGENTYPEGNS